MKRQLGIAVAGAVLAAGTAGGAGFAVTTHTSTSTHSTKAAKHAAHCANLLNDRADVLRRAATATNNGQRNRLNRQAQQLFDRWFRECV